MALPDEIQDAPPFGFQFPLEDAPAYPMIAPPEVWRGSPSADIDQANAAAPLNRVYATGTSNAFQAEQDAEAMRDPRVLAAMQRNRANVEEMAIRSAGQRRYQQEFDNLIAAGATPQEAARRAYYVSAGQLLFNHPEKILPSLPGNIPEQGRSVPYFGPGGDVVGNAIFDPTGKMHSFGFTPTPRVPPEVTASQKVAEGNVQDLRRELLQARKAAAEDPNDANLARKASILQQQLDQAQKQFIQGSTNWMQSPIKSKTETETQPPPSAETVVVAKVINGKRKRFSVPKSQLDEAVRAGYTAE